MEKCFVYIFTSIGLMMMALIFMGMQYGEVKTFLAPLKGVDTSLNAALSPPRQSNEWIILAFTDEKYLPAAKLWYKRLSTLGYQNHHLLAMDIFSYEDLMENNYRCEIVSYSVADSAGHSTVWKLRLETPLQYLRKGKNIFISDVDTHWNFYFNLTQLPPQYDSFHSYANVVPRRVLKLWGFTLCGCFIGYRANIKTVRLLEMLLQRCLEVKKRCDDQVILNEMFAYSYEMKWVGDTAFSKRYNYTISVFNRTFVFRSREISCKSWISMPYGKQKGTSKLRNWKLYNEICLS